MRCRIGGMHGDSAKNLELPVAGVGGQNSAGRSRDSVGTSVPLIEKGNPGEGSVVRLPDNSDTIASRTGLLL